MTVYWRLLPASSVPEGDDWLGPREKAVAAGLRFAKRKADWRLGRYVAKQSLAIITGTAPLDRIEIIAAEDGAPEAFVRGRRIDLEISISHREEVGACAIAPLAVGCDLEAIEPRTDRFVADFFAESERDAVATTPAALRDRQTALVWSAKESALKVLRTGLRRDTRSVRVDIGDSTTPQAGWHPLTATLVPENQLLHGWWRAEHGHVLTVVCRGTPDRTPAALS